MPSDLNFFYKYVCKQILRWPVITYVTLTDAEVDDSLMVSKYKGIYTWNQTKSRFSGHYLAKHVDSCLCFSVPCANVWRSQFIFVSCELLYGREKSLRYLIPVKHHQWLSTIEPMKNTLPWNVWVMIFRATFQRESKQKQQTSSR